MQSLSLFNPLPAFCMEAEVSPGKYGTQAHWSAKQLYQDAVDKKRKLDVAHRNLGEVVCKDFQIERLAFWHCLSICIVEH